MSKAMPTSKNILIIAQLFLFILLFNHARAQSNIKMLAEKKGISLRGLSIPSMNIIWASGSKGTIAQSVNGGNSFKWTTIKGYEDRDFRGIYAWDEKEAIVIAIASPAYILKTIDGGVNWYKVYQNEDSSMFLDAIYFKDPQNGFVIGDPVNQQHFELTTNDRGEHWVRFKPNYYLSPLAAGEAFFASSNSNFLIHPDLGQIYVTGGLASRLWINDKVYDLPILQGATTTGANSIALSPNNEQLMIVGGDFSNVSNQNNIVALSITNRPTNSLKNLPVASLHGYKSSVIYLTNSKLLACGTTGIDYSKDGGKSWQLLTNESFHVAQKQPNSKNVILAGKDGRIGQLIY
jgi:photosystem II stability/assembly factor-like uncharacterized protein